MNQVQKFQFGLVDLRVVDLQGQPWFIGSDVCHVLGLANTSQAVAKLAAADKAHLNIGLRGSPPLIVSETGLYQLIMRSDKPEARAFQDWVTRVVLPAIRKDGAYVLGEEKVVTGEMSEDELLLKAWGVMQRKLERLAQEKVALMAENLRMLPAAEVGHAVGQRARIGVVEFARKLEGVNIQQVQKDLQVMQYLYKRDGAWAVYSKHKGVLFDEVLAPNGRSKIVVLVQGQQLLMKLYRDAYLPIAPSSMLT